MSVSEINDYFEKQHKKFDLPDDYTLKFIEVNDQKKVQVYSKKKLLFEGTYDIIGLFNVNSSVWYWGWAVDFVDRSLVERSTEIKKYIKKSFYEKKPTEKQEQAIYFYAKTGSFMTNVENVLFLIKLSLFILKGEWFLQYTHSEDDMNTVKEFIIIKKIIE